MRLRSRRMKKGNSLADTISIWIVRIIIIGVIVWTVWAQNNFLKIDNIVYADSNMPKTFVGYNIVHISDINNSNINIASKVRKLEPDIIVVTGGYCDSNGNSSNTITTINSLAKIAPVYYIYNLDDTTSVLSGTQATDLTDLNIELTRSINDTRAFIEDVYGKEILDKADKGDEESLMYIDYITEQLSNSESNKINLFGLGLYNSENGKYEARDKAYELILNSTADYNIALLGNVRALDEVCKAEIDMLMFGGTYGTNRASDQYKKGMYNNNGTELFVSSGVGTTTGIIRIFNFPSIQCITLSDGTIENKNPLEKLMYMLIKDVGTIYENDGGFDIYKYENGNMPKGTTNN